MFLLWFIGSEQTLFRKVRANNIMFIDRDDSRENKQYKRWAFTGRLRVKKIN
jgi:hypothetical protein